MNMTTTHAPQCTGDGIGMAQGNQVANTILDQLGGRQFIAMTGAKLLVATDQGIQFKLPAGALEGINSVVINLNAQDTYDLYFHKIRGADVTERVVFYDVYADRLRERFTDATGLETSLGLGAEYNPAAVEKEIRRDPRIKGREAKAIHGLLKGRRRG